jgi:FMN phosphatase YigB (HAD superfamily)
MVKAVFFDYNGTLTIAENIESAWEKWYKQYQGWITLKIGAVDASEFKARVTASTRIQYSECRGWTRFMQQIRSLAETYEINVERGEVEKLADSLIDTWSGGMCLDPEAINTLRSLRENHKTGLISNWNHPPWLRRRLGEQDLLRLFDAVMISGELGFEKPDPRIVLEGLKVVGVEPSEAAYVGDDPVDLEVSLASGVRPILLCREGASYWDVTSTRRFDAFALEGVTVVRSLGELLATCNGTC